ncbi:hypothetical protein Vretimale_2667 [Volvox reticuliferus]|nr:hypothetical protein Vretimale_2667 [Volvox reticuliferus]
MGEDEWGTVAIAAIERFTLLIFPGSRHEIMELQRLEQLVTASVIEEADLTAWLAARKFKAMRLVLEPGDLLIMSGDTVHAGDRGVDGCGTLRLHWYITEGVAKDNSTTHLSHYGKELLKCFE